MKAGAHTKVAVLTDWKLHPGFTHAQAFDRSQRELFELRMKTMKGFVAGRMRRFLGAPNRYLVIHDYESREDALAEYADATIQEFLAARPHELYAPAPPEQESYVRVARVGK